jgi:hypothetical protein
MGTLKVKLAHRKPLRVAFLRTRPALVNSFHFLLLKPSSAPNAPPPQLVVVQHFGEGLKQLALVK